MEKNAFALSFVKEMQAEYTATKKCLERVPEKLYEYKPHPKSMAMGYLVLLVAEIPMWIRHIVQDGEIDFATFKHDEAKTTAELVANFEKYFQDAIRALQNVSDEDLQNKTFSLKTGGKEIFTTPKIDSVSSTINHWVHHRGQLTVYLRLNDIDVPSIYGPSADEKTF